MRISFISFSEGVAYRKSGRLIKKEAKQLHLFHRVKLYKKYDLPKPISEGLLSLCSRGFGYWLWKPWIILDMLNHICYGDIVVYADCGCKIEQDKGAWLSMLKKIDDKDILVMQYRQGEIYPWGNSDILRWTKYSMIQYFSKGVGEAWTLQQQVLSGFIVAKKTKETIKLMQDWFRIMAFKPELVIDTIGPEENNQNVSYIEHRHDQAILTALLLTCSYANIFFAKETIEPSQNYTRPFITALRRRDVPKLSRKTCVIKFIKELIGEKGYKFLHFWK